MQYGDKIKEMMAYIDKIIKNQTQIKKIIIYMHALKIYGIGEKTINKLLKKYEEFNTIKIFDKHIEVIKNDWPF